MKERCNLHHSEPGEDGLNFQGALHVFRPVFKRPTEPDHREDTEEETERKKKFAKKFGDSLQFIIPYTPAFFHTQMGGILKVEKIQVNSLLIWHIKTIWSIIFFNCFFLFELFYGILCFGRFTAIQKTQGDV